MAGNTGRLKEAVATLLRRAGVGWLLRRMAGRRRATILVYHDPAPETLDAHLDYLRRRYRFITLDRLVEAIRRRDESLLPDRAMVLTLDDGHRGNHRLIDVFRRHSVTPTIFLCSQVVNTRRRFWFKQDQFDSQTLKRLGDRDRLAALRRRTGFTLTRDYPPEERQALDLGELEALRPHADLQAHSRFHPVLTTCSDAQCADEIAQSRRDLERLLGRPCVHFSYPNGEYSRREVEAVRRAGYLSARTVDPGWNSMWSDPYRLKAMCVSDDASIDCLAFQLTGLGPLVRRLLWGSPGWNMGDSGMRRLTNVEEPPPKRLWLSREGGCQMSKE